MKCCSKLELSSRALILQNQPLVQVNFTQFAHFLESTLSFDGVMFLSYVASSVLWKAFTKAFQVGRFQSSLSKSQLLDHSKYRVPIITQFNPTSKPMFHGRQIYYIQMLRCCQVRTRNCQSKQSQFVSVTRKNKQKNTTIISNNQMVDLCEFN